MVRDERQRTVAPWPKGGHGDGVKGQHPRDDVKAEVELTYTSGRERSQWCRGVWGGEGYKMRSDRRHPLNPKARIGLSS